MKALSLYQSNQEIHHLQQKRRQDENYQQMVDLKLAHDRYLAHLDRRSEWSPEQTATLELLLKKADLSQRHVQRRQALESQDLTPQQRHALLSQLEADFQNELVLFTDLPALTLQEHEEVLQELYRRAVHQFVDQKLEQMQIHFHFEIA